MTNPTFDVPVIDLTPPRRLKEPRWFVYCDISITIRPESFTLQQTVHKPLYDTWCIVSGAREYDAKVAAVSLMRSMLQYVHPTQNMSQLTIKPYKVEAL